MTRPGASNMAQNMQSMMMQAMAQAMGIQAPPAMAQAMGMQQPMGMRQQQPSGPTNWKGELLSAYQRKTKANADKSVFVYEVTSPDERVNEHQATLTASESGSVYVGETAQSKKGAEQNAAKVALQELFPEHYSRVLASSGGMNSPNAFPMMQMMQQQGTKRKQGAMQPVMRQPEPDSPKNRLQQGVQLILGRSVTRDDMIFVVEEEGDIFKATCTITHLSQTYEGEPQASKKLAEVSAAEVALLALEDQIAPLKEVHEANKKQKRKAELEEFLAKKAAKDDPTLALADASSS